MMFLMLPLLLIACGQPDIIDEVDENSGAGIIVPEPNLMLENIGIKTRIYNLFDSWKLNTAVTGGRGSTYAEITKECVGNIETEYALTAAQWNDPVLRKNYYQKLDQLMIQTANQLIADWGNPFPASEKTIFIQAIKALSWQESRWQHYVRYKDWFFVFLSGGSYNALDDWGITQVARSGFEATVPLNEPYFQQKGYCKMSSSLYQGFTEYIEAYMIARSQSCNQTGNMIDKLAGAYNSYSSGFSTCFNAYSTDPAYKTYQTNAMNGFRNAYANQPWLALQ